ncbi:MAG: YciI family protein [Pseudomonadota bacterium]
MKYMCLIYSPPMENEPTEPGTPEFEAMMAPWIAFNEMVEKAGVSLGGDALLPVQTATTVRVRGGKTEMMDGPFAETKEQLGGYYIFECKDLDEALKYASQIPVHEYGSVEVRPIMDFEA